MPWFVTLFGRDALTVSFQTLSLTPRLAMGSLRALGALQADAYDDDRDMQPGKIEHEVADRHPGAGGAVVFLSASLRLD